LVPARIFSHSYASPDASLPAEIARLDPQRKTGAVWPAV
jgi:hypothetical protein